MSARSFLRSRSGRDLGVVLAVTLCLYPVLSTFRGPERFVGWLHDSIHRDLVGSLTETVTLLAVVTPATAVYAYRRWRDLVHEIRRRKRAESELRTLRGLIPICGFCRMIRDADGGWHSLEAYLRLYSEAELSHGLCPECAATRFRE